MNDAEATRKLLLDGWQQLNLPSQGAPSNASDVESTPSAGDQALSLEGASLSKEFMVTNREMNLHDGNATWRPADSVGELIVESPPSNEATDLASSRGTSQSARWDERSRANEAHAPPKRLEVEKPNLISNCMI